MVFSNPPGTQEVVVTRFFNAPKGIVFKTVTDPLLIPHWWGSRSLTTRVYKMVVTPGGAWRILQWDKEGRKYAFRGVYHDVVIPDRLVYTMEYEGLPGHPVLVTDQFTDQDGTTIMTSRTVFQSFEDRHQMLQWGMEEGSRETTERLQALLARNEFQIEFEKEGQLE
jgi:uncharacterized protein YndB with AHSA1/START domain